MSAQAAMIMIVEDEPRLASVLGDYLQAAGYATRWIANGQDVVPQARARMPDLFLLDLMLPGRDGLDICRELRTFTATPIVMVTARVEEVDRLIGLELGADDYICKPFSPREVVARVRAILRRVGRDPGQSPAAALRIDDERYRAEFHGQVLDLTPVEFRLLRTLAAEPGRVFSRDQLLGKLYTDHRVVTDRTVDSHIKNLRRKLQQINAGHELIHSIYGVGYKLEL